MSKSIEQFIVYHDHTGLKSALEELVHCIDINTMRIEGVSPLRFAIDKGSLSCASVLFDYGADPTAFGCIDTLINQALCGSVSFENITPLLQKMVNFRNVRSYKPYVHPTRLNDDDLMTLVKPIIENGSTDALKLLIKKGLIVNGYLPSGMTPLMWAVICYVNGTKPREVKACIRKLMKAGADPLVKSQNGRITAISIAATAEVPDLDLIRLLITEK